VRLAREGVDLDLRQNRRKRVGHVEVSRTLGSDLQQHRNVEFREAAGVERVRDERPKISERGWTVGDNRLPQLGGTDRVLRSLGRALTPDGSVLVADERVADRFHAPGDDMERLMYGWSIVHCLPVAMSESPSAAIGTVIRSETVRELGRAAGFARVEVLPVDAGFFRLYRLSLR
jgi:hypothetical protein